LECEATCSSWITHVPGDLDQEVYDLHLELVHKHGLDKLPVHPVWDSYPMKRQVMCEQYWVLVNDGSRSR
jgi:hypothetical protein